MVHGILFIQLTCLTVLSNNLFPGPLVFPLVLNPRPRFAYLLYIFGGSMMNIIKVICENNACPVLKNVWDSAHAWNHVICLRWPKCLIAFVLVDVDLPYWTSKVEHIISFTAIFSNICTAHAQKPLFMHFQCKFRHRRSIRWPRFPVRVENFGDLATFSVDFCILYAEFPPYFYFGLFDLLT